MARFVKRRLSRWQVKRVQLNAQRLGQHHDFPIRDTAQLRLDLRQGAPAQIPAQDTTTRRQPLLRDPLHVAQLSHLWPDDILQFGHAPILELDLNCNRVMNCSNNGAR